MKLYKVVTSKGKVFENVKADDIVYSHKIGKIRNGSKIQDQEGKWYRVEEFIKNTKLIEESRQAAANGGLQKNNISKSGIDFTGGNKKILSILEGKKVAQNNNRFGTWFNKYFFFDGRLFVLSLICFASIFMNVAMVFYYDLGKKNDSKDNEKRFSKKEIKSEKINAKQKNDKNSKEKTDKSKYDEYEKATKTTEGYYRSSDQKSYDDEKGKIYMREKARGN